VPAARLTQHGQPPATLSSHPIHESIRELDHEGMDALMLPLSKNEGATNVSAAARAHANFATYLARTHNTICGRHPIGVLLGALAKIEEDENRPATLRFVRYEQSSQCFSVKDSSVSYASAFVRF
jgi:MEMO1 family protein